MFIFFFWSLLYSTRWSANVLFTVIHAVKDPVTVGDVKDRLNLSLHIKSPHVVDNHVSSAIDMVCAGLLRIVQLTGCDATCVAWLEIDTKNSPKS